MENEKIYVADYDNMNNLCDVVGKIEAVNDCVNWLSEELLQDYCCRNEISNPEAIFLGLHAIRYLSELAQIEIEKTINNVDYLFKKIETKGTQGVKK